MDKNRKILQIKPNSVLDLQITLSIHLPQCKTPRAPSIDGNLRIRDLTSRIQLQLEQKLIVRIKRMLLLILESICLSLMKSKRNERHF